METPNLISCLLSSPPLCSSTPSIIWVRHGSAKPAPLPSAGLSNAWLNAPLTQFSWPRKSSKCSLGGHMSFTGHWEVLDIQQAKLKGISLTFLNTWILFLLREWKQLGALRLSPPFLLCPSLFSWLVKIQRNKPENHQLLQWLTREHLGHYIRLLTWLC